MEAHAALRSPPVTPTTSRIAFAHDLRGIAALSVLISHYGQAFWMMPIAVATLIAAPELEVKQPVLVVWVWNTLPKAFFGHFGVALFFLISGFVIPFSLAGRSRMGFAVARVLRVWPTYAIGLTITVLAVSVNAWHFSRTLPFDATTYLLQIFLLQDLAWQPSIDGIVWTLEIEAKFYALCLVLAPALRAGRVVPLVVVAFLLAAFTCSLPWVAGWLARADWPFTMLYALSLSGQMLPFMFVGAVFNLLHRGSVRPAQAGAAIACLLFLFAVQWARGLLSTSIVPGLVSYGVAFATFSLCFFARHRKQRTYGPVGWLADISYPLYVVHGVAGYVLMRFALGVGMPFILVLILTTAGALMLAWLIHIVVEVPTQRLGNRLSRRTPTGNSGKLSSRRQAAPAQ